MELNDKGNELQLTNNLTKQGTIKATLINSDEETENNMNLEPIKTRENSTSIAAQLIESMTVPSTKEKGGKKVENFLSKLKNVDRYQIPPSLELAQLHYRCSRISQPLTQEDLQDTSKLEICPCCCQMKTEPFPFFAKGSDIKNYGSMIPLYFQFTKYAQLVLLIFLLGNSYNFYTTGIVNCGVRRMSDKLNPQWCDGQYTLSDFYGSHHHFWKIENDIHTRLEVKEKFRVLRITRYMCFFVTYFSLIVVWAFFYLSQKEYKRNFKSDDISASDFTVMVGNVHDSATKTVIRDFIYEKIRENNLPAVKVAKVNIAKYSGNLDRLDLEIEDQNYIIQEIGNHMMDKSLTKTHLKTLKRKQKAAKRKKLNLQSKRWEYVRRCKKMESSKYNCVAFVTLQTNEDKKIVMRCKGKKKLCLCRMNSKKKEMKILRAIEPDDVKWKFIGFSTWKRAKTKVVSGFYIVLSLVIFYVVFSTLGVLKSCTTGDMQKKVDNRSLLTKILNFFISKVFGILTNIFAFLLEIVMNRLMRYEKYISIQKYMMSEISLITMSKFICIFVSIMTNVFIFDFDTNKLGFIKGKSYFQHLTNIGGLFFSYFYVNMFLVPLLTFFDPKYIMQLWARRKILKKLEKSEEGYLPMTQGDLLDLYERPESKITMKYSNVLLTLYMTAFLADTFPIVIIPALVFLVVQSFIDKLLFFNRYKAPLRAGDRVASEFASKSRDLPKLYFYGKYFFMILFDTQKFFHLGPTIFLFEIILYLVVIRIFEWVFDFWLMKRKRMITHIEAAESISKVKERTISRLSQGSDEGQYPATKRPSKRRGVLSFRNTMESFALSSDQSLESIPYSKVEPYIVLDYDRENPMTKKKAQKLWLYKKNKIQKNRGGGMIMASSQALFKTQNTIIPNSTTNLNSQEDLNGRDQVQSRNLTFLMKHIEALKEESIAEVDEPRYSFIEGSFQSSKPSTSNRFTTDTIIEESPASKQDAVMEEDEFEDSSVDSEEENYNEIL